MIIITLIIIENSHFNVNYNGRCWQLSLSLASLINGKDNNFACHNNKDYYRYIIIVIIVALLKILLWFISTPSLNPFNISYPYCFQFIKKCPLLSIFSTFPSEKEQSPICSTIVFIYKMPRMMISLSWQNRKWLY